MSPDDIKPYLNPEYWNGHSPDCSADESVEVPLTVLRGRVRADASRIIMGRIMAGRPDYPLEVFENGKQFSSDDIGALAVLRYEQLSFPNEDWPSVTDQPALLVSQNTNQGSSDYVNTEGPYGYRSVASWGVVQQPKKSAAPELYVTSRTSFEQLSSGRVIQMMPLYRRLPLPIVTGRVEHHHPTEPGKAHVLWRVNILRLIANGDVQRESSRLSALMRWRPATV